MAVDVLTIAQFGDGAAIARVAYDDLLGNVLGFRAVVERGELVATLSRQNGQCTAEYSARARPRNGCFHDYARQCRAHTRLE